MRAAPTPETRLDVRVPAGDGPRARDRESRFCDHPLERHARPRIGADPTARARSDRRGRVGIATPRFPPAELAAYTAVANIILNMDEVITKG